MNAKEMLQSAMVLMFKGQYGSCFGCELRRGEDTSKKLGTLLKIMGLEDGVYETFELKHDETYGHHVVVGSKCGNSPDPRWDALVDEVARLVDG